MHLPGVHAAHFPYTLKCVLCHITCMVGSEQAGGTCLLHLALLQRPTPSAEPLDPPVVYLGMPMMSPGLQAPTTVPEVKEPLDDGWILALNPEHVTIAFISFQVLTRLCMESAFKVADICVYFV